MRELTSWMAVMILGLTLMGGGGCASSQQKLARELGRVNDASYVPGEVSDRPVDVRVMSFNLRRPVAVDFWNHWTFRRSRAAAAVDLVQPDVLATQECTPGQARDLMKRLDGYAWVGAGRNNGRSSGPFTGEMCAVFYRSDRFEAVDQGHFWFGREPMRPGKRAWGAWWPRMATWVKLRQLETGRELFVFNAHLSSISSEARRRSASQLRDTAHRIAGATPMVIAGDFNAGEDTEPHRRLLRDGDLIDTFRAVHANRTLDLTAESTHHGFRERTRGHRIDWILTNDGFEATASGILHRRFGRGPLSDHYPVVSDLIFRHRDLFRLVQR